MYFVKHELLSYILKYVLESNLFPIFVPSPLILN